MMNKHLFIIIIILGCLQNKNRRRQRCHLAQERVVQIVLQSFAGERKIKTNKRGKSYPCKVNRYVKTHEGGRLNRSALIKVHTCRITPPPPPPPLSLSRPCSSLRPLLTLYREVGLHLSNAPTCVSQRFFFLFPPSLLSFFSLMAS